MANLGWSGNTDWTAAQSTTNIDINSGAFELADAIPDSGVARFEFEQDVTDSWNGYDGTQNGGSFTTDSQVGSYAIDFDGTDDYVSFGGISETQNVSGVSLSIWVKWGSFGSKKHVIGLYPDFDNGLFIGSDQSDGDNYRVRVENSGTRTQLLDTGVSGSTGTWYHLVATYNSGTLTFYIDGSEINSSSGGPSTTPSLSDWHIGGTTENGGYSNAQMDDARIYDKELTATEVSNLYDTGSING